MLLLMMIDPQISNSRLKRILLLVLGSISVGLGSLGIFLPLLPATPFLLLAAYCYLRSSRRLYTRLMQHRILGPYLYHYLEHKAVPLQTKIGAILLLWASLGLTMALVGRWYIQVSLTGIGLAVTIHLLSLRTLPQGPVTKVPPAEAEAPGDPLV